MPKYFLLILFLTMLTGCERCYEWHTVEITGITEYDGWPAYVSIGFSGDIVGSGTVNKEKLIVDLDETEDTWHGNFPVMVQFGYIAADFFVYTDGKTFQELQIEGRIEDIYSDFFDKLPKINFRKPKEVWGRDNITTIIEFSKFQKFDFYFPTGE